MTDLEFLTEAAERFSKANRASLLASLKTLPDDDLMTLSQTLHEIGKSASSLSNHLLLAAAGVDA